MSSRKLVAFLVLFGCPWLLPARAGSPLAPRSLTVPQCPAVHLQAAWLADASPAAGEPDARKQFSSSEVAGAAQRGPGYYLSLRNDTDHTIEIAQPFPSSVDWYAEAGSVGPAGGTGVRLLWRASSGSGGALVDALRPAGPLFATRMAPGAARLPVPAHSTVSWAEPIAGHPALTYRPSCERCRNPGDHRFHAVLGYALLPAPGEPAGALLACGVRSAPLLMPPLP